MRWIASALVLLTASLAMGQEVGGLVFYRTDRDNSAGERAVFCDGVELARLTPASYVMVIAAPGEHVCTVDAAKNRRGAVKLKVKVRQSIYLRADAKPRARLTVTNPVQGKKVTRKLAYLKTEFVMRDRIGTKEAP